MGQYVSKPENDDDDDDTIITKIVPETGRDSENSLGFDEVD